jgi:hypothetical protein
MFLKLTKVIMTVLSVTLLVFSFQNCSPSNGFKLNNKLNKSKVFSNIISTDSLLVAKDISTK